MGRGEKGRGEGVGNEKRSGEGGKAWGRVEGGRRGGRGDSGEGGKGGRSCGRGEGVGEGGERGGEGVGRRGRRGEGGERGEGWKSGQLWGRGEPLSLPCFRRRPRGECGGAGHTFIHKQQPSTHSCRMPLSPSPPPSTPLPPPFPISGAPPEASVEELATLLRKEQLNGYGVNAPHGPGGARKLRGSGLYARCSLINHECNPNVARFDAFDQGVTRIAFRAMHDLPAGGWRGRGVSWGRQGGGRDSKGRWRGARGANWYVRGGGSGGEGGEGGEHCGVAGLHASIRLTRA